MHNYIDFERQIQVLCTLQKDFDLSQISTIHTGGRARYYAVAYTTTVLQKIIKQCINHGIKYMLVGNCSNILFLDTQYDGLVISTKHLNKIIVSHNIITAQAGAMLGQVAYLAGQCGLSGLEWSVGIPATVGGAVVMNAGAYDGDVKGVLYSARVLDINMGKIITLKNVEYLAQHHKSLFTNNNNYVIMSVSFKLSYSNKNDVLTRTRQILLLRHQQQNVRFPSLGSVFCRGDSNYPPAYMIDKSNLKGFAVGGAMISPKHAGFIVNTGSATSNDVLQLIDCVKTRIKQQWGVLLQTEIIIGE